MVSGNEVGPMVRYHRKRAGLSQMELARLAGIGKTAVFDIENNKESVRCSTLDKVFHALNIMVKFESPLMDAYAREQESTADGGGKHAKG